jgi:sulfur carrier protein ThiS
MRLNIQLRNKIITREGETVEEIIKKCGYPIEGVIVLREGNVILEEDISDEDTIEIVPVASGG